MKLAILLSGWRQVLKTKELDENNDDVDNDDDDDDDQAKRAQPEFQKLGVLLSQAVDTFTASCDAVDQVCVA